jgi:hypothetical protein
VRKFCRRCGNSLATAVVASTSQSRKKPGRAPKVLAAGERPEHRSFNFGGVVRVGKYVVLGVVVVAGIAYGVLPQVRSSINSTIQSVTGKTPQLTSVQSSSVSASSAIAGHPAGRAVDAFVNTYWAASLTKDPQPKLTVAFPHAVNVSVMLFASGDTAAESSEPRPKSLHIVFSNGTTQDVTLTDTAKSQSVSISGAQGVTGMTIQITAVYTSTIGNAVALSDVEFFGAQS